MRLQILFSVFTLGYACDLTKEKNWPNGTFSAFHWWQCGGTTTYFSAKTLDLKGQSAYPIHLTEPLIVETEWETKAEFSKGTIATITLWSYGGVLGCQWSEVPTLGLLSRLDACSHGVPCPIPSGKQITRITLDFSNFGSVIRLLKDNTPYQLQYELKDESTGESSCMLSQARAFTK
ncbi:unnamed protein product, partial [Mesorhabditis belari]|uniref:MD-2-related lipid-recognition domain-containing protein n=1 Tax=Mesorhabditis belari TaxID=2138241 RepID=A0AAF3E9R9_9BILA